jgi:hypothetical protein
MFTGLPARIYISTEDGVRAELAEPFRTILAWTS